MTDTENAERIAAKLIGMFWVGAKVKLTHNRAADCVIVGQDAGGWIVKFPNPHAVGNTMRWQDSELLLDE